MDSAVPQRRGARFDFIAKAGAPTEERGADGDDPQQVWWRITAANNRTLGRSGPSFSSLADCRAHARTVHEGVEDLVTSLSSNGRGQWTWTAALDADLAARSNRPFPRRIDCVRTLSLFLAAARTADVDLGYLRLLHPRAKSIDMATNTSRARGR